MCCEYKPCEEEKSWGGVEGEWVDKGGGILVVILPPAMLPLKI